MISNKLTNIPNNYFKKTIKHKIKHKPLPLINITIKIPNKPTPQNIIDHFQKTLTIPKNQKYNTFHNKKTFKQTIINFYQKQYNITLNKKNKIYILYNTKNKLITIPTYIINPKNYILLPDPNYTNYLTNILLTNNKPIPLNLKPPHYLPN